jgi:hypothetical protein
MNKKISKRIKVCSNLKKNKFILSFKKIKIKNCIIGPDQELIGHFND